LPASTLFPYTPLFRSDIFGHKVLPALAAGNAVVVLPPLDDPLTILTCGALLREAGLPAGVLQIVTGEGPVAGEALTTSPKVDARSEEHTSELQSRFDL